MRAWLSGVARQAAVQHRLGGGDRGRPHRHGHDVERRPCDLARREAGSPRPPPTAPPRAARPGSAWVRRRGRRRSRSIPPTRLARACARARPATGVVQAAARPGAATSSRAPPIAARLRQREACPAIAGKAPARPARPSRGAIAAVSQPSPMPPEAGSRGHSASGAQAASTTSAEPGRPAAVCQMITAKAHASHARARKPAPAGTRLGGLGRVRGLGGGVWRPFCGPRRRRPDRSQQGDRGRGVAARAALAPRARHSLGLELLRPRSSASSRARRS